VIFVFALI